MRDRPKDADRTRAEILAAARELFASRGIKAVTIRDIAAEAGVAHSLVNRYFGSKDEMIYEILQREAAAFSASRAASLSSGEDGLELLRRSILYSFTEERTTQILMMRAELAGLEPEKMLDPHNRPLGMMRDWVAQLRAATGQEADARHDPAIITAIVGAAVFALSGLSPWILTAVGLEPEELETRQSEFADALVDFVAHATGNEAS